LTVDGSNLYLKRSRSITSLSPFPEYVGTLLGRLPTTEANDGYQAAHWLMFDHSPCIHGVNVTPMSSPSGVCKRVTV
jgi:hypothetical protein